MRPPLTNIEPGEFMSKTRFATFPRLFLLILTFSALLASCASEERGGTNDNSGAIARGSPGGRHGSAVRAGKPQQAESAQVAARLVRPQSMAVDRVGNYLFADTRGNRILRVDASGRTTIFAGTGSRGFSGDGGPAVSAALSSPCAVAVDSSGIVYVADSSNNVVRKIDAAGIISTVAGNGGQGAWGDGGPATSAQLSEPTSLAFDRNGDLLIFDSGNARLRMIASNGTITTVAAVRVDPPPGVPAGVQPQAP